MEPIDYIKAKTIDIKHSHSNLFEHSYNLYLLLQHMNCSKDICLAGLFHSIYGNNYFDPKLGVERKFIKKLIGKKAEELVYRFNNTKNRDEYFLKNADEEESLFLICYVNLIDQSEGQSDELVNKYLKKYKEMFSIFYKKPKVKIIDDLLDQTDFYEISSLATSKDFPWYFSKGKVDDEYSQFVHTFVYNSSVNSNFINKLDPIFTRINAKRLFRVKLNLTAKTDKIIEYKYHQDVNIACKTAVFYINTNNGYTQLKEGKKIHSKANRIAIFDSYVDHFGTSCTNKDYRIVLNINYL